DNAHYPFDLIQELVGVAPPRAHQSGIYFSHYAMHGWRVSKGWEEESMSSNHRRSFLKSAGAGLAGMFGLPKLSEGLQVATRPYQRPKLKITDIKTAYLQGFHVRIYTDQGLTGDGEAVDAISGAAGIVQGFRFALMNQDPLNVEAIWERI